MRYRAVRESIKVTAGTGTATPAGPSLPALRVEDPGLLSLVQDRGRGGGARLLPAGGTLSIGPARAGQRSYLAVRGGIAAGRVLVSSAPDVLSGLAPEPIGAGDTLRVQPPHGLGAARANEANPLRVSADAVTVLRCVAGPRDAWFREGVAALTGREWTVTRRSNRVGLRLDGTSLERGEGGRAAQRGSGGGLRPGSPAGHTRVIPARSPGHRRLPGGNPPPHSRRRRPPGAHPRAGRFPLRHRPGGPGVQGRAALPLSQQGRTAARPGHGRGAALPGAGGAGRPRRRGPLPRHLSRAYIRTVFADVRDPGAVHEELALAAHLMFEPSLREVTQADAAC